ncbi:hypothetical protein DDZ14_01665 [Maritimibacter sp. 55A14]|uniref:hypothetical protein n=1 Tax=Maritimibacter sp. 55A14 TaxID=2174844 RepID=UPI000D622270|nr:hypothetical protein [Maritimibacter sp. 55A14]PWE33902.1 hypothetical protein DDZ14_01665 [Maritimibacter sp. 55A14]
MSDTDSFIDEVTEEIRRDRLYGYLRRYGWIAIVAVLSVVGGAAWNEYRKATETAAAQALGDALLATDSPAALAQVSSADPEAQALVDFVRAAALAEDGERADAAALLREVSTRDGIAQVYRDLAGFKALILEAPDLAPETRIAQLERYAQPGGPFRGLALEQQALAQIEAGDRVAAAETLRRVMEDAATTPGLRQRASQMMVALGEDPAGL